MSLRASVATQLELPSRLWAERLADGLGWLASGALAWVVLRQGAAGLGLALGGMAAMALWLASRRARIAGTVEVSPGAATRRLGPTLVVTARSLKHDCSRGTAWLTPADLPADRLRRLWIQLRAAHRKSGT